MVTSPASVDPLNPYAAAHVSPTGMGDSRPTAIQIVEDEGRVGALNGKVALVTGGNGTLGVETVRALRVTGARVFFTARNQERIDETLRQLGDKGDEVIGLVADFESLDTVCAAANEFLRQSDKLSIFIANAGFLACPEGRTKDGFERQYSINFLSHFLLFKLLEPAILRASTNEFNSRIVMLSSTAHMVSQVEFDNTLLEGIYDPWKAYGQSKTAEIWMANYIDRVYGPRGVHAYSLHPGGIWSTLQRHVNPAQMKHWRSDPETNKYMKTPAQGAATTLWAAVGTAWEGKGGKYLQDCAVAKPVDGVELVSGGHAAWVYAPTSEDRLWQLATSQVQQWFV